MNIFLNKISVKSISGFALLTAGGALIAAPSVQAETNLLLNHYMPANHLMIRTIVQPWADEVTKATNGRVKVEIPVAKITGPKKQWNSVVSGTAGLSISSHGFQRKRQRLMDVGHLPFGATTAKKGSIALLRTYNKFFKPANEFKGVKFLSVWLPGPNVLFTKEKQVKEVADFKGLKLRSNAGIGAAAVASLGGSPVTSSGTEVFNLVSKGIVDGLTFPPDAVERFKIGKYLKYATMIPGGLYANSWTFIMNQKQWDGISKADQQAVEAAAGEKMSANAISFDKKWEGSINNLFNKKGIVRYDLSDAAMATLRKQVAAIEQEYFKDAAKKGVDGKAALAFFRQQVSTIKQ